MGTTSVLHTLTLVAVIATIFVTLPGQGMRAADLQCAAANRLPLRAGAAIAYAEVGTVPFGTAVSVTAWQHGWGKITHAGKTGWASGAFLSPTMPATAVPICYANTWDQTPCAPFWIAEAISGSATLHAISFEFLMRLAACESNFTPAAVNPRTGDSGLFQWRPSTWAAYASGSIWSVHDQRHHTARAHQAGYRHWWVCSGRIPIDHRAPDTETAAAVTPVAGIPPVLTATWPVMTGTQSSNPNAAVNAFDNNLNTSWQTTTATTPSSAWVTFDLGSPRPISSIWWTYRLSGAADSVAIAVLKEGIGWSTVLPIAGNAAAFAWQSLPVYATAQKVRFTFANPNGDRVLAYLAEVRIAGAAVVNPSPTATTLPTATLTMTPTAILPTPSPDVTSPTATANPGTAEILPGTHHPIISGGRTANSAPAATAFDRNLATWWATIPSAIPPITAYFYVDLGAVKAIAAIDWLFPITGQADDFQLQVSDDRVTWRTIVRPNNAPAGVWQRVLLSDRGRYLRALFTNPHR